MLHWAGGHTETSCRHGRLQPAPARPRGANGAQVPGELGQLSPVGPAPAPQSADAGHVTAGWRSSAPAADVREAFAECGRRWKARPAAAAQPRWPLTELRVRGASARPPAFYWSRPETAIPHGGNQRHGSTAAHRQLYRTTVQDPPYSPPERNPSLPVGRRGSGSWLAHSYPHSKSQWLKNSQNEKLGRTCFPTAHYQSMKSAEAPTVTRPS